MLAALPNHERGLQPESVFGDVGLATASFAPSPHYVQVNSLVIDEYP